MNTCEKDIKLVRESICDYTSVGGCENCTINKTCWIGKKILGELEVKNE